jgi:hypothetical protein
VIDERGLVAVHLNGINHHARRTPDPIGYNPLNVLGVYRAESDKFYLYERHVAVANVATGELGWDWKPYPDYTDSINVPRYILGIDRGYAVPLAAYCEIYDYSADYGFGNIGCWIDAAAQRTGR